MHGTCVKPSTTPSEPCVIHNIHKPLLAPSYIVMVPHGQSVPVDTPFTRIAIDFCKTRR